MVMAASYKMENSSVSEESSIHKELTEPEAESKLITETKTEEETSSLKSCETITVHVDHAELYLRSKLCLVRESNQTVTSTQTKSTIEAPNNAHIFKDLCLAKIKENAGSSHPINPCAPTPHTLIPHEPNSTDQYRSHIERLKLEAVQWTVKSAVMKAEKETIKLKNRCQTCRYRDIEYKLAENTFVQRKINCIRKPSFERQLEHHLYERDPITLLGEVVNYCVAPSATSEEIWMKMREQLNRLT